MKNALLIFAFLSFYLSSVHASVEIRSNKLTTGDGLGIIPSDICFRTARDLCGWEPSTD
mgnify:CR=1 FL=1